MENSMLCKEERCGAYVSYRLFVGKVSCIPFTRSPYLRDTSRPSNSPDEFWRFVELNAPLQYFCPWKRDHFLPAKKRA